MSTGVLVGVTWRVGRGVFVGGTNKVGVNVKVSVGGTGVRLGPGVWDGVGSGCGGVSDEFNVARKNSYKRNRTPWQIIHQRDQSISHAVAALPAIPLDSFLKRTIKKPNLRGYLLIQYPY